MASSGSSLTSVTSSILQGKMEDGRLYAVYGKEGRVYSFLEDMCSAHPRQSMVFP